MKRLIRQTAVIARRDFIATVATPTFLFFLMAPFFMLAFGLVGGLGASQVSQGARIDAEMVALVDARDGARLQASDRALRAIYRPGDAPPPLRVIAPVGDLETQVRGLFDRPETLTAAVLAGPLEHPHIWSGPTGSRTAAYLEQLAERVLRDARADLTPGERLSHATMTKIRAAPPPGASRMGIGFAAVFALFFLTLLLAGQAVGMMAEEKGNKVIEILAAAVPLETVFLGKLIGMFGVALLFIAFWGAIGLGGLLYAGGGESAALARLAPAIGVSTFLILFAAYFTMAYLLLGAVFLGVGAQAGTVREIQMLSLPITIFQVGMFGLSSAAASSPGSTVARVAETIPFSSPFAMAARAATDAAIWPHLIALGWQLLWVAAIITIAARLFRRGVLKSGSGPLFGTTRARETG